VAICGELLEYKFGRRGVRKSHAARGSGDEIKAVRAKQEETAEQEEAAEQEETAQRGGTNCRTNSAPARGDTLDPMPLKLGYKASAEQFDPRELVEIAVAAEAHGMESVAVSDHFQPWRHEGGHAPFSLTWMAAVGERTSSIRIGTSVMTPTFRYNPAVIAQAFATMGVLYPGRIFLGVGTGEALNEIATGFRGAGEQEWPEFKERFARLREAVDLMRTLWSEDRVNFAGEYYSTHDASIYDRPASPIPVYVAAGGPVVARYAGRAGDGFICTSGKGMDLYTEQLIPAVKEGAEQADRSYDDIDRMIEIKVSYDTDPEKALQNTRFWAPLALSKEEKHDITDPVEMERAADALPIEQIASRWIVGSDPDKVVDDIRKYVDAGFTHLVFHGPGADQRRFLELFEKDLAPRLRAL
jgi:coenzyme F420-dependent glucose-6-phosphate dehydrogenase